MEDYSYKVTVRFMDSTFVEFYASETFDASGDGRVLVWSHGSIKGESFEYYSIPTSVIRDVLEKGL